MVSPPAPAGPLAKGDKSAFLAQHVSLCTCLDILVRQAFYSAGIFFSETPLSACRTQPDRSNTLPKRIIPREQDQKATGEEPCQSSQA